MCLFANIEDEKEFLKLFDRLVTSIEKRNEIDQEVLKRQSFYIPQGEPVPPKNNQYYNAQSGSENQNVFNDKWWLLIVIFLLLSNTGNHDWNMKGDTQHESF